MKPRIIAIGFMVLGVCVCSSARGADKTFDSNGQILPGETWDTVYVRNNGTVVDMSGGQVGGLRLSDNSIFNMSGGDITGGIDAQGTSYFDMSNGTIDVDSTVVLYGVGGSFSGGNVTATGLKTGIDSSVEFTGGVLNFNIFNIIGDLTIKGGVLHVNNSYIDYFSSTINIYGHGFNYNPTGGAYGDGILTGYLLDNNFFSMDQLNASEFQRFNLIPEPTTLLLLGIGGLLIRKRN